jgi:hypothetical protein
VEPLQQGRRFDLKLKATPSFQKGRKVVIPMQRVLGQGVLDVSPNTRIFRYGSTWLEE